jgi:hypothetical protein
MKTAFQLNWYAFLISFAIGIAYVYFTTPRPRIVIKYPNPYNSEKITYQDDTKACYKYKAEKVVCPKDETEITPQPISIA